MRTEPRLRRHKGRPVYRKVKSSIVYEMNHETTIGEAQEFKPKKVKVPSRKKEDKKHMMESYYINLQIFLRYVKNTGDRIRIQVEILNVEQWLKEVR